MDERTKRLAEQIAALEEQAADLRQKGEAAASYGQTKSAKEELAELRQRIAELMAEKASLESDLTVKGLGKQMSDLQAAFQAARKPTEYAFAGGVPTASLTGEYAGGKHSFFADVKAAGKGDRGAYDRLHESLEGKAMSEGTNSAGGWLVAPEISDELIRLREARTVLRSLCSKIDVTSDTLEIASITGGLGAAWTAELAEKPAFDMTFGQQTVSIYTLAALAVVSNQLLADSKPGIDGLIAGDLAYRLAKAEEIALINGSGTGQPTGILNQSGVGSVTYTDASPTVLELLDKIVEAIGQVEQEFFGFPSHIVLHPRTWAWIQKDRTDNVYTIGSGANSGGRVPSDALPSRSLFGVPVVTTPNVPTNLGAGTNESRVIVGDFSQALILDRQGITIDDSSHVYFTSNKTVFRGEERMGFTAGRYPDAFSVVGGTGLAGV